MERKDTDNRFPDREFWETDALKGEVRSADGVQETAAAAGLDVISEVKEIDAVREAGAGAGSDLVAKAEAADIAEEEEAEDSEEESAEELAAQAAKQFKIGLTIMVACLVIPLLCTLIGPRLHNAQIQPVLDRITKVCSYGFYLGLIFVFRSYMIRNKIPR